MRVLLVEDDGFVRLEFAEVLREAGLTIVEARDGAAAIEMLRQYPAQFDALVTDLMLPGGPDGGAVAALMRRQRPDAPIVLTSGSVSGLEIQHQRDDAYRVLTKPFHASELLALLRAPMVPPGDAAALRQDAEGCEKD